MAGPLTATLWRLDGEDGPTRYVVGRPDEAGWMALTDALAAPEVVDGWYSDVRCRGGGRGDVAGSFLASWLSGIVVDTVAAAVLRERRAWPLNLDGRLVHRHADGWFDGLAVVAPIVFVLPDDPAAGHPDAVLLDDEVALRRRFVAEAVAALTPLFAAVWARAPYGVRGMWGAVADGIAGGALRQARRRDEDGDAAFAAAMTLVDALAAETPLLRVRPSLVTVEWSGGTGHGSRKGTCCLWYKAQEARDPRDDGYCTSCPRRDRDHQRARWARSFEEDARQRAVTSTGADSAVS